MNQLGLAFCQTDNFNSFCIALRKTVQLSISMVLLLIILYDMAQRVRRQRECNFFVVVCFEMLLALSSNIAYDLDHQVIELFYFEVLFTKLYFATIMYQVCLKFVRKYYQEQRAAWIVLNGLFILLCMFLLTAIVLKILNHNKTVCNAIWLLVINIVVLLVSFVFVSVGIRFDRKEKLRIQGIYKAQHYKNPLPYMWIWIIINILCNAVSFIQNLIFKLNPAYTCTFTQNPNIDPWIKLIFAILEMQIGVLSTIIFFRMKYSNIIKDIPSPTKLKSTFLIQEIQSNSRHRVSFGGGFRMSMLNGMVVQLTQTSNPLSIRPSNLGHAQQQGNTSGTY